MSQVSHDQDYIRVTPVQNMRENDCSTRIPAVDLVYFDAGGGHRAAANALLAVLKEQQRPWNVRLMNLQLVLDSLDIFRKITGVRLEDLYNLILAKGWTLGSAQLLKMVHLAIRMNHGRAVRLLEQHWSETQPDLVVSLVPNFNRVLFDSLRAARPATPYVTILTDFADYPPHFWMERQKQYLVCGTERAVRQAEALGYAPEDVFRASGMILRPKFYESREVDRAAERRRLGLDPERPTALVMFGGQGARVMLEIAERLGNSGLPLQTILICGRNEALRSRLRSLKTPAPMYVEGFTTDIPYYMRLADFFIGKPGPGSISEAIAMRLPVIVESNLWTLPQERYNAEWVLENRVGFVVPNFRQIAEAARKLLDPATLTSYRANTSAIRNRAIYEIPEILDGLLTMDRC
jgi:UDP-N-acetylglucosamine:LPS N-acetylglucosamine transferase